GGCANDYVYVHGDPINAWDLDGLRKSCRQLLDYIIAELKQVKKRFNDLINDPLKLPPINPTPGKPGTIAGHIDQFKQRQKNVRGGISTYNQQGCGGPDGRGGSIPRDAWKWSTRQLPIQDPRLRSSAGGHGGGGGAGGGRGGNLTLIGAAGIVAISLWSYGGFGGGGPISLSM
ncbi:MAG TPA: hypothetical protein VIY86_13770, partial [Pirellulaceae bacterium]